MGTELVETGFDGLFVIKPQVFVDERGNFHESYRAEFFEKFGLISHFVQDNQSMSGKAVLRGLHYQVEPYAQTKLVRVSQGAIFDVALDLRPNSSTFKRYFCIELSGQNSLQLYIPRGFAHGFLSLADNTICSYKVDNYYNPEAERGVNFADEELSIAWPQLETSPRLSPRDEALPRLKEIRW